jgi:predicted flap endonuclease-1-like 5' DNA nuclease
MSLETLSREQIGNDSISEETVQTIGMTVFEKLAQDTENEVANVETIVPIEIRNSVTRLGDGQTVPDEC